MKEKIRTILRAEKGLLRNLPVTAAICCWVAAILFVKYFSLLMDVHTQNFFRYLGASLFLALILKMVYPGCFRRYRRNYRTYLILGAMMTSFQLCWVHSLYLVDPDNVLVGIDAFTGQKVANIPIDSPVSSIPMVAHDMIYLSTKEGHLLAYGH